MKLADKIYLSMPNKFAENWNDFSNMVEWDLVQRDCCINVPYVNKETLIEWAEGEIERLDQYDRYESGLISGLKKLVEHLKSM